ncbi:hypothetical protein [Nonomuraea typhae]|uniref:hypothetical protein n=1 Tax=Nonomuraea typhae TaxID=2603600 RepID=UPI001FE2948A|nr:hypothetical protein [Nonomuraea typhae]
MDTGPTLAMIAASTRAAYGPGRHLRVRSSGIVHDVTLTKWLAPVSSCPARPAWSAWPAGIPALRTLTPGRSPANAACD